VTGGAARKKCILLQNKEKMFLCLLYNSGSGGEGSVAVSCLESREEQVWFG
jgi:hypothetical protein